MPNSVAPPNVAVAVAISPVGPLGPIAVSSDAEDARATVTAAPRSSHLEWFHDHVRIEHMRSDGVPVARNGCIRPDLGRPGLSLGLKTADAVHYKA